MPYPRNIHNEGFVLQVTNLKAAIAKNETEAAFVAFHGVIHASPLNLEFYYLNLPECQQFYWRAPIKILGQVTSTRAYHGPGIFLRILQFNGAFVQLPIDTQNFK